MSTSPMLNDLTLLENTIRRTAKSNVQNIKRTYTHANGSLINVVITKSKFSIHYLRNHTDITITKYIDRVDYNCVIKNNLECNEWVRPDEMIASVISIIQKIINFKSPKVQLKSYLLAIRSKYAEGFSSNFTQTIADIDKKVIIKSKNNVITLDTLRNSSSPRYDMHIIYDVSMDHIQLNLELFDPKTKEWNEVESSTAYKVIIDYLWQHHGPLLAKI